MLKNNTKRVVDNSYWSGVFAMTLCVFVLLSSEFMPVSLLTPIANDLHITEGRVGQGIAISGAFAVLTSLSVSYIARRINRKTLLLALTLVMGISGAVVASAPNYIIYMIGRALIGIVIGGFWSMTAATAIRLVPEQDVARALGIFNSGNALAMVIAAPLGSYLGGTIGWRGAFYCLVPIALITFIWQWISLPSMPNQSVDQKQKSSLGLLTQPIVLIGMIAVGLFFMGQFSLYTYIRPFLEHTTHVSNATLSLILMCIGGMGILGTSIVPIFLNRQFEATLLTIPIIMAIIALNLIFFSNHFIVVVTLLGFWGFLATSAPVGWWNWLAKTLPDNAEAGGGLMVAIVQFSIALGSTLGGLLFDHGGYQITFVLSAFILLVSAFFTLKL